jgi:hypothetical protein
MCRSDRRAHRAELPKPVAPERLTPDPADLKGLRRLAGTQNEQDQNPHNRHARFTVRYDLLAK